MNAPKTITKWSVLMLLLWHLGGSYPCSAQTGSPRNTAPNDGPSLMEVWNSRHASEPDNESASDPDSSKQTGKEGKSPSDQSETGHNGSFVAAPLPIVSPALGTGIIPVLGYITPIPSKDRKLEPSVIGAGGLITDDGSRGFGLGADLYLDKARYEVESIYAHGNLDYNLYGVGFGNGNAGFKLPLEQAGHLFFFKTLRRIGWDFYAGLRFIDGSSFITLKPASGNTPPIPPDVGLHTDLRALGMEISRDSRPNRFYPLKGSVIDFTGDFFGQDLGPQIFIPIVQVHLQQILEPHR